MRQRRAGDIESRFRREVKPRVPQRLSLESQAAFEESLAMTRRAHALVHDATFSLSESLTWQTPTGKKTARHLLSSVIAACTMAREALED